MNEGTLDNLIINELNMPTKIYVGDESYIESRNIAKENEDVFDKSFKCKSKWVGEANLKKVEIKVKENIELADYLTIIYAPNKKLLELYKKKSIYDYQKFKNIELLAPSKRALVELNENKTSFDFNNTGLFADILEVYGTTTKLEGLIINLYLGNNKNFEELKEKINDLFK